MLSSLSVSTTPLLRTLPISAATSCAELIAFKAVSRWAPVRIGGTTKYAFSQCQVVDWVIFIFSSKLLSARTVQQALTSSILASMATPSYASQLTSSHKVSCSSPNRSTHLLQRCLTHRFLHTPRRTKFRVAKPVSHSHLPRRIDVIAMLIVRVTTS